MLSVLSPPFGRFPYQKEFSLRLENLIELNRICDLLSQIAHIPHSLADEQFSLPQKESEYAFFSIAESRDIAPHLTKRTELKHSEPIQQLSANYL